ncbi:MAG TPA: NAD(P)H-binding protein [Longimicrobium sp.]|nr:NAD(P)H-binding protein [Longimicrobium sp.]
MRILLTGGTGGLGRELVRAAEAAGHTVRIASRSARPGDVPAGREWARMDLGTGQGVREALAGADAVIHAASDPRRHAEVDVQGTRRLADAARAAGTPHLVYVSIVGIDDIPFAYYRAKLAAERIVAESGVPHSILRATQFHAFVESMIAGFARVPLVLPLPSGFRFQPVDTGEAADRYVRAAQAGPGGRLTDFGGPEVLTLGKMARAWKAARGIRKPVVPLPLPGGVAAAFREGRNTLRTGGERGTVRWEDWLRASASSVAPPGR